MTREELQDVLEGVTAWEAYERARKVGCYQARDFLEHVADSVRWKHERNRSLRQAARVDE